MGNVLSDEERSEAGDSRDGGRQHHGGLSTRKGGNGDVKRRGGGGGDSGSAGSRRQQLAHLESMQHVNPVNNGKPPPRSTFAAEAEEEQRKASELRNRLALSGVSLAQISSRNLDALTGVQNTTLDSTEEGIELGAESATKVPGEWDPHDDTVLQRTPNVVFRPRVFFAQLFFHLAAPFILPFQSSTLGSARRSTMATKYRHQAPFHLLVFFAGIVQPTLIWIAVITFIVFPEKMKESKISLFELIVPITLVVLHRTMIGIKYASLTRREYSTLLDPNQGQDKAWLWAKQIMLYTGWVFPPRNVVETEIHMAAARQGLSLKSLLFRVAPMSSTFWLTKVFRPDVANADGHVAKADGQDEECAPSKDGQSMADSPCVRKWSAFIGNENVHVDPDTGDIEFGAHALCSAVVRHASSYNYRPRLAMAIVGLCATIHICIPFAQRAFVFGVPIFGRSWPALIVGVCSAIPNLVYFFFGFGFLVTLLLDLLRQYMMVRMMGHLVTVTAESVAIDRRQDKRTPLWGGCGSPGDFNGEEDEDDDSGFSSTANAELNSGSRFMQSFCIDRDVMGSLGASTPYFNAATVPRIELWKASNIRAWLYSRVIMMDWGKRYRGRMALFFFAEVAFALVLLVSIATKFVMNLSNDTGNSQLREDVIVLYCAFDVLCWGALVIAAFLFAGATNALPQKHAREVIFQRLQIRDMVARAQTLHSHAELMSLTGASHGHETASLTNPEQRAILAEHFEICDDLLDSSLTALDILKESNPVKVLGFPASAELAYSVATLLFGSYMFFINQLFVQ